MFRGASWQRVAAAGLGLAFVAVTLGVRALWGAIPRTSFGDDLLFQYYPAYLATAAQLGAGTLSLWNPYQLCGVPWLAALQTGVLYPPHLLYGALPLQLGMPLLALSHVALAAFGAALFARRLGVGWYGALFAAGLYTLRGQLIVLSATPNVLEAAVWLAPGCAAVVDLVDGRWRRGVTWLAFASAMSALAGYPQVTVYCAYFWGLLLVALGVARRLAPGQGARALLALGAAGALGAAIAALQLLPAAELAAVGTRSLGTLTKQMMLPYGGSSYLLGALDLQLHYRSADLLPVTLGAVALALLPVSLLAARQRAVAWALFALGLLALAVALGPGTPLFDLYRALPLLGSFRSPSKIMFVADFFVAVGAGIGLDAIVGSVSGQARAARRRRGLAPAVAGLAAVGVGVALWRIGNLPSAVIVWLLALFLVVPAWGSRPGPRSAAWVGVTALVLGFIELGVHPLRMPSLLYMEPERRSIFHRELDVYQKMRESPDRAWVVGTGLAPQLPPRLATVFRFRSIDDYEPANTRRQAQYLQYLMRGAKGLEPGRFTFSGWLELIGMYVDPEALEQRSRLLDLAAVRWVLVPLGLGMRANFARWFRWAGLEPAGAYENLRLYENPRALPRAFVTYRFEEAPPTEALLEQLAQPDFDPLVSSYVEGVADWEVAAGAPARGAAATIAVDDPERVEVQADLAAPGLLVLADTYYPGWRASLAGRELEIRPVNHLFRGVRLPAGRHRVRFEYRPLSVAAGAAISAAALGIWGLLLWRTRREGPRA